MDRWDRWTGGQATGSVVHERLMDYGEATLRWPEPLDRGECLVGHVNHTLACQRHKRLCVGFFCRLALIGQPDIR